MRKKLKWNNQPFEVPQEILDEWRNIGNKGEQLENEWLKTINKKIRKLKVNLTALMRNWIFILIFRHCLAI